MVRKKPAPDVIRGGYRFSEKTMLKRKQAMGLIQRRWIRP